MQIIPLDNSPNHSFVATLSVNGNNISLSFFLTYNESAGYWLMRISDPGTGLIILDSLPLLTDGTQAANLLAQYHYLKIGSAYLVKVAPSDTDYPNNTNLGTIFLLLWGDNTEKYSAISVSEAVSIAASLEAEGVPYGIIQLAGRDGVPGTRGGLGPVGPASVVPGPQGEVGPIGPQGEVGPIGPPFVQTAYSSTMSGNETLNSNGKFRIVCFLDPDGVDRNFTPGTGYSAGDEIVILNVGNNMITFDPTGLNESVGAAQTEHFFYNGTNWF
jgi:hypothetical protein